MIIKKTAFSIIDKIIKWHQFFQHEIIRERYGMPKCFGFIGKDINIKGDGKMIVGKGSYICNNSSIHLDKDYKVAIGSGCSISHNVKMYTHSKIADYDFKFKKDVPEKKGDIIIGDFVWIGANVFINPGVIIGDNSVIGANSVVTSDILPFGIYGGVPAKLIRMKNKINV